MRRSREDGAEHEPCPHCGKNACTWHLPGRRCDYAYLDQPGEVRPQPQITASTMASRKVA